MLEIDGSRPCRYLVYAHLHSPDCCASLNVGIPATDIEWATDTTRTIASLLQRNRGALDALLRLVPVSQVVFGADFPFRTGAEVIEGLTAHRFAAKDLRAIEGLNRSLAVAAR